MRRTLLLAITMSLVVPPTLGVAAPLMKEPVQLYSEVVQSLNGLNSGSACNSSDKKTKRRPADERPDFSIERGKLKLTLHGHLETAPWLQQMHRKEGGNEMQNGPIDLGLDVSMRYQLEGWVDDLTVHIDWANSVLDFNDPKEANFHNSNWIRADSYESRPQLLISLDANSELKNDGHVRVRGGQFLASGLEAIDGAPNRYYLTLPAPLLHTQHYDKGIEGAYWSGDIKNPNFLIKAAVVAGDWSIGEADASSYHDSRANSYPAYSGHLRLNIMKAISEKLSARVGDLSVGAIAHGTDIGSFPGAKRRQENQIYYVGYARPLGNGDFEVRVAQTFMKRNQQGDGMGAHTPSVATTGSSVEATYRNVQIGRANLDFYANTWKMKNKSGEPDGEIWVVKNKTDPKRAREAWGWTAGVTWNDPVKTGYKKGSYASAQIGQLEVDEPIVYGSNEKPANILIFAIGSQF